MNHEGSGRTIGRLARAAGVGVETIRFYQRKRLLRTPDRAFGGIRRYADSDVERLRFIKRSQRLGFSLAEIDDLLKLDDGAHCDEAAAIAAARLAGVRTRLADLRRIESGLARLVERCRTQRGRVPCPLIAALHANGEGSRAG